MVHKCWAVTTVTDTNDCRQFTIYVSVSDASPPLTLTPAPEGGVTVTEEIKVPAWCYPPELFVDKSEVQGWILAPVPRLCGLRSVLPLL